MLTSPLKGLALAILVATGLAVPAAAREVRIASHVSETSPLYATAEMFVKRLDEKLPGKFDFKIYPNGQLGKEKALIQNVRLGSLEMAMVASGVLALDDKLGIFDLPWLFPDRAAVERALDGPFGRAVKQRLEDREGFVVLGIYENGFRDVVNTRRPIRTPADLKGLKIRVTGSEYKREGFSTLGADPVPIAWQETFTAIQQGVVDGAEAALYGFYGQKLYQIDKYLSLTHHTWSPSFLIVSKSFWNSLSPAEQKTFQKVADGMTPDAFAISAKLAQGYIDKMKGKIEINQVDPKPFQAAVKPVYESYEKRFGDDWIKMIREAEKQS